jgi:truncated hemoglobin YjbI
MSQLYQDIGGTAACRRLSEALYARVARDPLLRPFFPGKTLHCAIEEFTAFLVQFLGGPPEDSQRRWWLSLHESHRRFKIGRQERDAWMRLMVKALDEVAMKEPEKTALRAFFEQASKYLINTGPESTAVDRVHMQGCPHQEIASRWDAQRTLDDAVAAIRKGDAAGVTKLAERFEHDRSILVGLLAEMIGRGSGAMVEYVHRKLRDDPMLARQSYGGRTLLNSASAAGDLATVDLLLRLGADLNAGRHTSLHCVANECRADSGASVVRALVKGGADVNAAEGVKRCTALHMAARRGNVKVAEALLDCGAEVDPRDSLGETPLRRAVNCGKTEVAALLVARGADVRSVGSKGLTPLSAARTTAMKSVLSRSDFS